MRFDKHKQFRLSLIIYVIHEERKGMDWKQLACTSNDYIIAIIGFF